MVTIQRAKTATELKKENEELRASLAVAQENLDSAQNELTNATDQLAYSEEQVNLLEESTSALVAMVAAEQNCFVLVGILSIGKLLGAQRRQYMGNDCRQS